MPERTNLFEPEIIGGIVEDEKRVVIKVKGSTTVALEKTLLDKIAIKHFGSLYAEAEKDTKKYIREQYAHLSDYGFKGVAYVRVSLLLEITDEKVCKEYLNAIRNQQNKRRD